MCLLCYSWEVCLALKQSFWNSVYWMQIELFIYYQKFMNNYITSKPDIEMSAMNKKNGAIQAVQSKLMNFVLIELKDAKLAEAVGDEKFRMFLPVIQTYIKQFESKLLDKTLRDAALNDLQNMFVTVLSPQLQAKAPAELSDNQKKQLLEIILQICKIEF